MPNRVSVKTSAQQGNPVQPANRHSWTTRLFLRRRRWDGLALSLAFALLPVASVASVVLFGFFSGVGSYVVLARHRAVRLIDRVYLLAAAGLALGAVVLAAINGTLTSDFRWISYAFFFLAGAVFFVGWVHVRNPLRQAVLGARAGVVLASLIALFEVARGVERVGFGSNQANAAFVLAAIAILARIRVPGAPRLLGNSRAWFYLAIIPMVLTGTRTTLPLIVICLISDIVEYVGIRRPRRAVVLAAMAAVLLTLFAPVVAVTQFGMPVPERLQQTQTELRALFGDPLDHSDGLSIRLVLWDQAVETIRTRPWTGSGGEASMKRILAGIPAHQERFADFIHVHNLVLDELRIRGLFGLMMHLGFFIVVFGRLYRRGNDDIAQNAMLFALWMLLYGSLHGLLMADRNVMVVTLYLVTVLASVNRNRYARKPGLSDEVTATGIRAGA